jgi:hypothetical protein
MAGLVPAIHVFLVPCKRKAWMPGTRPGMTWSCFTPTGNALNGAQYYGCGLPPNEGIITLEKNSEWRRSKCPAPTSAR